jgi:peptidoglycan/LPS O-acetylase OafA/YrhL
LDGVAPKRPPTSWDGRHNNFDALRLLLALLVIFSHCYPLAAGNLEYEPLLHLSRLQFSFGGMAVYLFFVMSGFLITASMERSRSAGQFLRRRIVRIYPAFIAFALISFFVIARISGAILIASPWHRWADAVWQTLRLREYTYANAFPYSASGNRAINGATWSIPYEFFCYLGVLLLGVTSLLKWRVWPLLLLFAAIAMSVAFALNPWSGVGWQWFGQTIGMPSLWAQLLPNYLAGMVFYLYRDRIPYSRWLALLSLALVIIAARLPCGESVVFPLAGAYLLFYLAFAPWLPLHQAARFGDFSYGLYLWGYPIQQLLVQHTGHPETPLHLFATAAPLAFMAAVLSWYGVERHFLRRGRRHETVLHALADARA